MTEAVAPKAGSVAIVGMAGLFPGAASTEALWANIVAGHDAISEVPAARWDPVFFDPEATSADRFYCRRGGFVDDIATFDPTAFGIMPLAVDGTEPDQLLALAAAAAALDDAGRPHEHIDPARIGVIIGRGGYVNAGVGRLEQRVRTSQQLVEALRSLVPGIDDATLDRVRHEFQERLGPERPESSIGLVPNLAASRIANRLDLQGPAYTIDAACASSHLAVDQGMAELASGRCDLVLAGGVHHCHDLTIWSVFTQLRALSPTGEIRPFSQKADGILIGEGTGLFVLKRLADAERDDDRIYAVIRGSGVSSDGRDASLMSPRPQGQQLALRRAWEMAGLDPATVGLVEAHGTATPAGDAAELDTLRVVFGPVESGHARAGLGSVKSMIGHAMPAAGAAGLAKAALAVFHGVLPPTLHADDANPRIDDTRFRLITEAEPWVADGPRRAAVNAFGFGGINAHLVIEEHPSGRKPAAAAPLARDVGAVADPGPEAEATLLLAGPDAASLLEQLAAWPGGDDARHAPAGGPARLAIVDPTPKRLELARRVLERGTHFRGRNDVWFEPEGLISGGGKVAFLFPGVEPQFEPRADDIAEHFGLAMPSIPAGAPSLERQSRGIVGLGRLLAAALDRIGIRPDLIAGHSLGEWTGQIVSGMVPTDYIDDFIERLRPGAIEVSDVVFVALGCGAETAASVIEGLPDTSVSHDNCPHQSVICGTPESIVQAMERVRERKIMAQELPFRSGFHSPLFEPFVGGLAAQFADLVMEAPTVPLWSATTCAPYPDGHDDIADLAVRHLVEPVRFRELVLRLHDEGVRAFVQVGTGSLGGFIDDTLRDTEFLAVSANVAKQSGLGQLRRVAAALWAEGVPVDFDALVTHGADLAPAPRSGSTGAGAGPALALGTTLVRDLTPLDLSPFGGPTFSGSAGSPGGSASEAARVGGSPLLAEYQAMLDDAAAAARLVADAADARRRTGGPPRPATVVPPSTGATARAASPVERPSAPAATGSISVDRPLSLAEQPYWADHAFFSQPDGWPESEDAFPLVPMTAILEFLAEAAVELLPGQVPVALTDVRAFRWLAVDPPTTVTVRAALATDGPEPPVPGATAVRASIDGHARATVWAAPQYPPAPAPVARPIHGEIDLPATPVTLYSERHLFHGPEYQGVRSFDEFGEDGVRGRLESLPAPGSLLDNAGQLFGFWVACAVEHDRLVLPTSIDRIAYYGPHPAPGTTVDCVVNVTHLDDQVVRADLELTVDGVVWVVIEGWEDRRFQTDDGLFAVLRKPHHLAVAEPQPGGWALVTERWHDSATRDVVMRRFLGKPEREVYEGHNPNVQRQWLLGRVAAKDAARLHLWAAGTGPLYPVEVTVSNDADGAPTLSGSFDADLRVSLAHVAGVGVALVAEGVDVGIDVAAVEPRVRSFAGTVLTLDEQALLGIDVADDDRPEPDAAAPPSERDRALTRAWAAKEAAAKAAGTGLQGRPRDFVIEEVDGDRLRIGERWIALATIMVPNPTLTTTTPAAAGVDQAKEHVVAWTIIER